MPDLDKLYGAAIAPDPVGTYERHKQSTWLLVDETGAGLLQAFIDQAASGAYVCRHLSEGFNTLWLIAENGTIRVAIEEIVLEDHHEFMTAPMPKLYRASSKLGHPSLVEGGPGRVGGELSLNVSEGTCYLTNGSGRFGYERRSEAELENAAEAFRKLGVDVTAKYVSRTW